MSTRLQGWLMAGAGAATAGAMTVGALLLWPAPQTPAAVPSSEAPTEAATGAGQAGARPADAAAAAGADKAAASPETGPASLEVGAAAAAEVVAPEGGVPGPRFDHVRIEADGSSVIAGRAAPGARVMLMVDQGLLAETVAGPNGQFVFVTRLPLDGTAKQLELVVDQPEGRKVALLMVEPLPAVAAVDAEPRPPEGATPQDQAEVAAEGEAGVAAGTDLAVRAEDAPALAQPGPDGQAQASAEDEAAPSDAAIAAGDSADSDAEPVTVARASEISDTAPGSEADPDKAAETLAAAKRAAEGAAKDAAEAATDPVAVGGDIAVAGTAEPAGVAETIEAAAGVAPSAPALAAEAADPEAAAEPVDIVAAIDPAQSDRASAAKGAAGPAPTEPLVIAGAVAEPPHGPGILPGPGGLFALSEAPLAGQAPKLPGAEAFLGASLPGPLGAGTSVGGGDGLSEAALPAADAAPRVSHAGRVTDGAPQLSSDADPLAAANADPALAGSSVPVAPRVVVADETGVRVLQSGEPPSVQSSQLALDSISYAPDGAVILAGRGAADRFVRVYVDNSEVITASIGADGQWQTDLPSVDKGVYTLRVDELDEEGAVTSRTETPFQREDPDEVAAELAAAGGDPSLPVTVVVQPGNTLWGIARGAYGRGTLYVRVFEANRGRIRNPHLIYPGQVFDMPVVPR